MGWEVLNNRVIFMDSLGNNIETDTCLATGDNQS